MKKIFTILVAALFAANVMAEFGYGVVFTQNDFNNSSTVVEKAEGEIIEWDSDGVRCGGTDRGAFSSDAWNWDDKYFVVKLTNGVPDKVTFQYIGYFATTRTNVYVKESANGSDWTDLWSTTSNVSDWTAVTETLKPTTRYLRFGFSGNFSASFKDIKVTEKILMGTPNPESLDFGTVKVDAVAEAQTFTLGWTNLTGTATSSDVHFTVTPDAFGEIGANLQTETFTVSLITSEAGVYSGTITVEGRGKSAQVAVSGTVEKYDQTIAWNPAETVTLGGTIALATATSGLEVSYQIANPAVLKYENGAFVTLAAGTTSVTAKQAGNYKYNAAADVVRTITVTKQDVVIVPVELSFCQGGSVEFRGVSYTAAGQVSVTATGAVRDTTFVLTISELLPSSSNEEKTIAYSASETWNGYDLSEFGVGQHELIYTGTNVAGCDSVVTLALTVTKAANVTESVDLAFCAGDTAEFHGVLYTEAGTYNLVAEGEVCDTVFTIFVEVYEPEYVELHAVVVAGEPFELPGEWWLGEELVSGVYTPTEADVPEIVFVQYGQTEEGCESRTEYIITVTSKEGVENVSAGGETRKFFRDGVLYIRRGEGVYTATGERVE